MRERRKSLTSSVIRDEKGDIGVVQDGGDADEPSATTGHDSDVLPSVLGVFALAVVLIIQVGDSLS